MFYFRKCQKNLGVPLKQKLGGLVGQTESDKKKEKYIVIKSPCLIIHPKQISEKKLFKQRSYSTIPGLYTNPVCFSDE